MPLQSRSSFNNCPFLTILYNCQSWHSYSIVLQLCFIQHANLHLHLDVYSETSTEMSSRRGQRRREKGIQEGLACIITLSRWHIYHLCQRGHAFCRSKRSGVWKSQLQHTGWPFNNYYHIPSTHYHDGDCDSMRITTLSCHIATKTGLLWDGGDSAALKNQLNKGGQVKWGSGEKKRRERNRQRYGGRMVRTIAPYSTLAGCQAPESFPMKSTTNKTLACLYSLSVSTCPGSCIKH